MSSIAAGMLSLYGCTMPHISSYGTLEQNSVMLGGTRVETPKLGKRRRVSEDEQCMVCGAPATGFHYGVAACHGCKGFFRRTILSGEELVCRFDGNCEISPKERCICRRCRLDKCFRAVMDVSALQGERDKRTTTITKTVKAELPSPTSKVRSTPPVFAQQRLADQLADVEGLCQELRLKELDTSDIVKDALAKPCMLFLLDSLESDLDTLLRVLRPATMHDVQTWNVREMRVCLEWAKALDGFRELSEQDQVVLVKNFALRFTFLNRAFYSTDDDSEKLVLPSGAFDESMRIPGCPWTFDRQIHELLRPLRKLQLTTSEFALFKAVLFFDSDCANLSHDGKTIVDAQRERLNSALLHTVFAKLGVEAGALRYGALLLLASPLTSIVHQAVENIRVLEVFDQFWTVDDLVKELCL